MQKLSQQINNNNNNDNNKDNSNKYNNNKIVMSKTIKQLLTNEFNISDNEIKSAISNNNTK